MKTIAITYSKQAQKFLANNSGILTELQTNNLIRKAIRKLLKIDKNNIDITALHGELQGLYRIRRGAIRIIFGYTNDEIVLVKIERIDHRSNVYR